MANMSYCRFENTYSDLVDCNDALSDESLDELSESERNYAMKLIKLCKEISDDFSDEVD